MTKSIPLLVAMLVFSVAFADNDKSSLDLIITTDKTAYASGEQIRLQVTIQNTACHEVKLTHAEDIHHNLGILFKKASGDSYPLALFQSEEPKHITVMLKPQEKITHKITGTIVYEKGYIGGMNDMKNVHGIFVRFPNMFDSFLGPDHGDFTIQGSLSEIMVNNDRKKLRSNQIKISISEKI